MSHTSKQVCARIDDREYSFALVLTAANDLTDDLLNRLFEAGCDDATLSMCGGQIRADFDRVAPSYDQAVKSAITAVRRAGLNAELS